MTADLSEMVVVVTGGASGIGRATCLRFADQGATVIVADIRKDPREDGEPTHALIEQAGGEARFVHTDVRNWDSMRNLVDTVVNEYGRVDVFINNAGFAERGPIEDFPQEHFTQIVDVNLSGVFYGTKAAAQQMLRQDTGAIVIISSVAGKEPDSGLAAYCGAKAGVIRFSEAVAMELDDEHIRVNVVCPSQTQTAMTGMTGQDTEPVVEKIVSAATTDQTGRVLDA